MYYLDASPEDGSTAGGVIKDPLIRGGIRRVSDGRYFWYFSTKKRVSKSGTVHAGVDAVEQARTCVGSSAAVLHYYILQL